MLTLYGEDSVYIFPAGAEPRVGLESIRELVQGFDDNAKDVKLYRHLYRNGDTALVVVDWTMKQRNEVGTYDDAAGTAVDVLKKRDDGTWYYLIDNPFGAS